MEKTLTSNRPADSHTDGSGPAAIDARDVARSFGRRWVLRGVSLRVEAGEAIALMGRNGSGKTTLLRILSTLLRPSRGGAAVFGLDVVKEAAEVRERIGLLGHAPGLYEDLTAAENLRFAYRMCGEKPSDADVRSALERVGLGHDVEHRVRGFSAGMRRRLALARVLIRPPDLLLLDEPYASFDAEGIHQVNTFVAESKARGAAVVIATHDLARARGVVDRVVRIEAGRLVELESGPHPSLVSAV